MMEEIKEGKKKSLGSFPHIQGAVFKSFGQKVGLP